MTVHLPMTARNVRRFAYTFRPCPTCGARPGERCHTRGGHVTQHGPRKPARYEVVRAWWEGTPTMWQVLGPITRTVMLQRRTGTLDPAAANPRVYALLLRTAIEADRLNRDGVRIPRQRDGARQ